MVFKCCSYYISDCPTSSELNQLFIFTSSLGFLTSVEQINRNVFPRYLKES